MAPKRVVRDITSSVRDITECRACETHKATIAELRAMIEEMEADSSTLTRRRAEHAARVKAYRDRRANGKG
jgi:hypothetical protein